MSFLNRLFGKKSGPRGVKAAGEHGNPAEDPSQKTAAAPGKPVETTGGQPPIAAPAPPPPAERSAGPELTVEDAQRKLERILAEITDMVMGKVAARPIGLDTITELSAAAKFLWDGDPRRVDAQALYWWAQDKLKTVRGPFELKEADRELIIAVVFAIFALMARSEAERIQKMQQSLLHAREAGSVGGAEMLVVRLSHTLGPMGKLP